MPVPTGSERSLAPETGAEGGLEGASGDIAAVAGRLRAVRERIAELERRYGREPGSVRLLAVSKTKPPAAVRAAWAAGQREFGENHLQDALSKLDALTDLEAVWHFIGPVQSNKTRTIAARFAWVHSIDRARIARRLDEQRPEGLPPLDVCVQVNVSGEASKAGVAVEEIGRLAETLAPLRRLRVRGLMAVPAPTRSLDAQRVPLRRLREALSRLEAAGFAPDTLSMGMTDDLEAAIAEGATIVRIGTAIFGARG